MWPGVEGPIKSDALAWPVAPTSSATLTATRYTPPEAGEKFLGLNVKPGWVAEGTGVPFTDHWYVCESSVPGSVTAANSD